VVHREAADVAGQEHHPFSSIDVNLQSFHLRIFEESRLDGGGDDGIVDVLAQSAIRLGRISRIGARPDRWDPPPCSP
jgi:hypothetical protein